MPRGGRGGGRSTSRSPPPRSSTTASQPTTHAQQPPMQAQQSRPGLFGGLGSTLVQGMAFGAGSQVAHQAIRGVMGGNGHSQPAEQQQQPQQTNVHPIVKQMQQSNQQMCMNEINMLTNCLSTNSDISYCQNFSDMLKQCQQRSPM